MSQKHLFKFQTDADYRTAKRNHLTIPNMSTVIENGKTYINMPFVSKENAEAGDIIAFHTENDGTKTVRFIKPEAFDKNDNYWTADAIVVVPYTHTGDGTVRAMALNCASTTNPENGSGFDNPEGIVLSGTTNINGLEQYGGFTIFSSISDQTSESTVGVDYDDIYSFPSDAYLNVYKTNPYDIETAYVQTTERQYLSSPYNNDGTPSNAFGSKGDFSQYTSNPFRDMDGSKNTENILKALDNEYLNESLYGQTLINETYVDVHTDGISDDVRVVLFPAAAACARYSSVLKPCVFDTTMPFIRKNINTMPWYLPSAGEIAYYAARKARIEFALKQAGKVFAELPLCVASSTVGYGIVVYEDNEGCFKYRDIDSVNIIIPFCKF